MAGTFLADFPAVPGNKPFTIVDIPGPASYTQVGVATPPTGGVTINAADIGLTNIEFFMVLGSDNGQYGGEPIIDSTFLGRGAATVRFLAYVLNTGAQVTGATDLSGRTFRVFAFGR